MYLEARSLPRVALERLLTLVAMASGSLPNRGAAGGIRSAHGGHPTRRFGVTLAVFAGMLASVGTAFAADRVDISAVIEPDTGAVEGTMQWTVTNRTEVPLTEVLLFAYPEAYRADPDLPDILLERVYPSAFEAGGQSVHDASVTMDGTTSDVAVVLREGEVPVFVVPLPVPLAPGGKTTVAFGFHTQVPRKYGSFGRFRRMITLNGGLAPMPVDVAPDGTWLLNAAPPRTQKRVTLDMPAAWGGVVGGVVLEPRGGAVNVSTALNPATSIAQVVPQATTRFAQVALDESEDRRRVEVFAEEARWTTIALHRGRASTVHHLPIGEGRTATFVGRKLRRVQKRWVRWAASNADQVLRDAGIDVGTRGVVIVEAPLRRKLVELGDGVILVSDRYLEIERPFWRFMDVHLARAFLAEGLDDTIDARESPLRGPLTLDGVSWGLIPAYLERRWEKALNLRKLLEQFDFIPQVDDLLQTPVYPFADQIFDNPYVVDPLRADVRRFNRPLRSGRVLFLRLADHLEDEAVETGVAEYLRGGGDGDLYALLSTDAVATEPLADAWLGPIPRANLLLDPLVRGRTESGKHTTEVTLRREQLEGDRTHHPTEIVLRMGPRREPVTLIWDGKEDVQTWNVETDHRVGVAVLDPRGRVLEIDRDGLAIKYDNRRPRTIDVTAWGYLLGAAITGTTLVVKAGVNFRPERDLRHRLSVEAFHDERALAGGTLAYTRYFGKPRLGAYRRHRIIGAFDFSWLDQSELQTDAPLLAEVRATYRYDDRRWSFKPTKGGFVEASVFGGKDFALNGESGRSLAESGYIGLDVSGSYLFRLHPWHLVGLRGRVGSVFGSVAHRQFSLGGRGNVRGVPSDTVLGSTRALLTVEWRHTFIRDLDVRIPWLFSRLRSVRGALFVEGGVVSDRITELPKPGQAAIAVGYGVRFFVDWFGFLPGMFGVDVAWSPGGVSSGVLPLSPSPEDWVDVPFQVYLVGTQSF